MRHPVDSFKLNIFLEKKQKKTKKKERFNFQRPTNRKMFSQSSFPGFFAKKLFFLITFFYIEWFRCLTENLSVIYNSIVKVSQI